MSNMSYCRFENTANDMADCVRAIRDAIEDGISVSSFMQELSSDHERSGFRHLLRDAKEFIELCDELGVNETELRV